MIPSQVDCRHSAKTFRTPAIRPFLWLLVLYSVTLATQAIGQIPVARKTDSPDHDLITTMLEVGLVDTAGGLCERERRSVDTGSEQDAAWLLRWSRVQCVKILRSKSKDELELADNTHQELDRFSLNHPHHPRMLWIDHQKLLVDAAMAQKQLSTAMATAGDVSEKEDAIQPLGRVAGQMRDLSLRVEEAIARERAKKPDSPMVRDLLSLALQLASQRIDLLLLRADLFDEGSADMIASANESMTAAKGLMDSLPIGAESRRDLSFQYAESARRTGDLETATAAIEQWQSEFPDDPRATAVKSLVAMDQERMEDAESMLFSGQIDARVPIEWELARVRWLLTRAANIPSSAEDYQRRIGQLIQRVDRQHGDYARRRVERWVVGTMAESTVSLDPQIVIAQASARLRDGDAQTAGAMLATAFQNSAEPAAAFQLAIAAAAAFSKSNDFESASDVLREAALTHDKQADAPKLHLQAAYLLDKVGKSELTQSMLAELVNRWPASDEALIACDWAIRINAAQEEFPAAYQVALTVDPSRMTSQRLVHALGLWLMSAQSVPVEQRNSLATDALPRFARHHSTQPVAVESATLAIASLALNVQSLSHQSPPMDASSSSTWIAWLYDHRRSGQFTEFPTMLTDDALIGLLGSPSLEQRVVPKLAWPADGYRLAIERLILDGQQQPSRRVASAKIVIHLTDAAKLDGTVHTARALAWMGKGPEAEKVLSQIGNAKANDVIFKKVAAEILSESTDEVGQRASIRRWSELASGAPQGSDLWHEAKVGTIKTMIRLGDREKASQLIEYILLTQSNIPERWLSLYRQLKNTQQ